MAIPDPSDPPAPQFGLHFLPPSPDQHKEKFREIHNIQYVYTHHLFKETNP